jgi:Tfp pilus assembly protein PilF
MIRCSGAALGYRIVVSANTISAMRLVWLLSIWALHCSGYELTGRLEPPAAVPVFLHGATAPFESSTVSGADGRFRFAKLAGGTYTLAISNAARTIEIGPGTADSKGRLDVVIKIDPGPSASATVSVKVLSIPERAMKEFEEATRCLSRRDSECASSRLRRAVEMAPQFTAAWNEMGVIAYQTRHYSDAEANFRKALDADAQAFEPLVNLGGVLLNLGKPREALGYNQRAVTRRPNDALANSQLGLSYFDLNDPKQAEHYLKIAVQLDPAHFSHPQLVLAEIYMRRGDRAAALLALRGFLAWHPDSPEAPGVREKIVELSR